MAERKPGRANVGDRPPVPLPPDNLQGLVTRMVWPTGRTIHRIHLDRFRGTQFNPGQRGNARFSPIRSADGTSIPTIYGGTTFDCAAMETVFHDVPFVAGLKTYDRRKLDGQVHSLVMPARDLTLADLSTTALRRIGIRRGQLIDTEKDRYPEPRAWAEAIHARCPDVEGLCWISRQDDRARALMLFGDRVTEDVFQQSSGPLGITASLDLYSDLLALADRIGLKMVGSLP